VPVIVKTLRTTCLVTQIRVSVPAETRTPSFVGPSDQVCVSQPLQDGGRRSGAAPAEQIGRASP